MDRATDYGSEGCRFDSGRAHDSKEGQKNMIIFLKPLARTVAKYHQIMIGVLVSIVIFRQHANFSFFVGDDFQVYQAWSDPNSLMSNNITAIRDFSQDKWRPLNNFVTSTLMTTFKNYSAWNALGIILWIAILQLMMLFRRSWSQGNKTHVLVGMIVITLSPTLWYVQNSVFVFLELGPIIAILTGLILFEKADKNQTKVSIIYSAIWIGIAGLFHERFYIVSFAFALICYLRSRTKPIYKSAHLLYFAIPIVWIYSMTVVLGANPLQGGGETGFSNNMGTWIIRNISIAFLEIFRLRGRVIVFGSSIPTTSDYGVAIALFLIFTGLTYLIRKHLGFRGLELWVLAIATALPAGLVYERVEPRWLLAPTVIICILAWMTIDNRSMSRSRYFLILPLVAFISFTVQAQAKFNDFEKWRTESQEIVNFAAKNAPLAGEWHLSIELLDGSAEWRGWALGGGAVFGENISNGPSTFNQYFDDCPTRCMVLQVNSVGNRLKISMKNNFSL